LFITNHRPIAAGLPRSRKNNTAGLERRVGDQLHSAAGGEAHRIKARRAGVCAGDEDRISGEGAAELHDAVKVEEEERLQLAALVVHSHKTVVSLCIERGKALRKMSVLD
jgi:hypothetical protein